MTEPAVRAAIVDCGMGNLFSVQQACNTVGLPAVITADPREVVDADVVLLPGVGAYADAMSTLRRLDLVSPLRDRAAAGELLVGICLGLQLLMEESDEFGRHEGLGIIKGRVRRFETPTGWPGRLKVPHIGWTPIAFPAAGTAARAGAGGVWWDHALSSVRSGEYMYFVHSYYAVPADPSVILASSQYGPVEFCSSVVSGSVFAMQFHPERSGARGLEIYKDIAVLARRRRSACEEKHA